jgi:hypothetical protein
VPRVRQGNVRRLCRVGHRDTQPDQASLLIQGVSLQRRIVLNNPTRRANTELSAGGQVRIDGDAPSRVSSRPFDGSTARGASANAGTSSPEPARSRRRRRGRLEPRQAGVRRRGPDRRPRLRGRYGRCARRRRPGSPQDPGRPPARPARRLQVSRAGAVGHRAERHLPRQQEFRGAGLRLLVSHSGPAGARWPCAATCSATQGHDVIDQLRRVFNSLPRERDL